MRRERASYGRQTCCELCGSDVEWLGKAKREEIAPGVTLVRGGWTDRGGIRFCDESGAARWDENGAPVPFPHVLHRGALS